MKSYAIAGTGARIAYAKIAMVSAAVIGSWAVVFAVGRALLALARLIEV